MILKIGSKKITRFESVSLNLKYDSVASTFSFNYYYDNNESQVPELNEIGAYKTVTIEDNGLLILTGTILSHGFVDGPAKGLTAISGYSKPGVLEDCSIPISAYPLQSDNKTFSEIVSRLVKPFGIGYTVDPIVSGPANKPISVTTAEAGQSVKAYLAEVASQRNIILSHDANGSLLLTRAKENQAPKHNLTKYSATNWSLTFNGQTMHSEITVIKQASLDGGNSGQSSVSNPFVRGVFRPLVKIQTSGDDVDTSLAARSALSDELRSITLSFTLSSWYIDGEFVTPNIVVSVVNEEIGLVKKSDWFVEDVKFSGTATNQTCVLTCVLPSVHSTRIVKNIFV